MSPIGSQKQKFDYFIQHRDAAREQYEMPSAALSDCNPLLLELRIVFDWMAQEKGVQRIPSRLFKQRLPEIHRKFPMLAANFARMDANGDCWLEWHEFASFCLKDERLSNMMKRAGSLFVYGVEQDGRRTFKDTLDPLHCSESIIAPLLPWEQSQVIEWRIEGLAYPTGGRPVSYHSRKIEHGRCLASKPFRAAGVCGYLQFWPVSYWTETQMRVKSQSAVTKLEESTCQPMPSWNTWCCVGACMPIGTNLECRFYIGDVKSDWRDTYWQRGIDAGQLFAPEAHGGGPPAHIRASLNNGEPLVVGMEIRRNKGIVHGRQSKKARKLTHEARNNCRPLLKIQGSMPRESILLKSNSCGALTALSQPASPVKIPDNPLLMASTMPTLRQSASDPGLLSKPGSPGSPGSFGSPKARGSLMSCLADVPGMGVPVLPPVSLKSGTPPIGSPAKTRTMSSKSQRSQMSATAMSGKSYGSPTRTPSSPWPGVKSAAGSSPGADPTMKQIPGIPAGWGL
eukprot:TRINITY_DN95765_c0_g1_i1.p1 TRINITY_DN95765_c0_g1~~TRINITY_DN95765_c0_g1_i1.p1  ORF type:complete len:511 (-),score=61.61 TRINITY_DN95765_c0_g1_i1:118-1650(-)